ncbi:gliding motility lipoprotein GldH [Carboxylicivirga mesophila]|uniref:Gliding motility lipoprotein GldH n=1 Tax=Carboxylicivirga mesophila TaxID=1166478 RepID=A0ABS5K5Y7_9BACT|nr:gliding motility lipoprotein GldH [Carboxylicivirga mesophila]MBS2210371.1 gliding motility lipoprotein GldH [Carboxylicivirga mesophila]
MDKIKHSSLIIILLGLIVVSSCDRGVVFDQYVTIPKGGWHVDSMAVFKVDIESTEQPYNVILNVRNRSNYPNSNLWLFVEVVSPSGQTMQDKVDCVLADDAGRWIGSGWGDLYHAKIPYQLGVKFAETGAYSFRIVQGMRDEDLEGIHNIGLRVERANVAKE